MHSTYQWQTLGNEEVQRLHHQAKVLSHTEQHLLNSLGLPPTAHIVELGAGQGGYTPTLCDLVPHGSVTAIEVDPLAVQHFTAPTNARLVQADVHALPLPDSCADAVIARFLLQHVSDPSTVLAEAFRVLKPGGIFVGADSDRRLLRINPMPELVAQVLKDAAWAQREQGGDPEIGGRMASLCVEAGFCQVDERQITLTNNDLPMSQLAGLALGYKARLVGVEPKAVIAALAPDTQFETAVVVSMARKEVA